MRLIGHCQVNDGGQTGEGASAEGSYIPSPNAVRKYGVYDSAPGYVQQYATGWQPNVVERHWSVVQAEFERDQRMVQGALDRYMYSPFMPLVYKPEIRAMHEALPSVQTARNELLDHIRWQESVSDTYGALAQEVIAEAAARRQRVIALARERAKMSEPSAVAGSHPLHLAYVDPNCVITPEEVTRRQKQAAIKQRIYEINTHPSARPESTVSADFPKNIMREVVATRIWEGVRNAPPERKGTVALFSSVPYVIAQVGGYAEDIWNTAVYTKNLIRAGMSNFGYYAGSGDSSYLTSGVGQFGGATVLTAASILGLDELAFGAGKAGAFVKHQRAFPQRSLEFGPSAKGVSTLTIDQLALHERLSLATFQGTRSVEVPSGTLSFADVAALSSATGWEHAVVRLKDGTRMLVRGGADNVSDVLKLDVRRLVVHSHPGDTLYHLAPSGPMGDVGYLWRLGQRRSYIVTTGTRSPGIDYWLGTFNDQGYWRALNNPPMMPAGGNVLP